ncbi:MAG: DUF4435 domain-containing protein [Chloroflexota bacterium]
MSDRSRPRTLHQKKEQSRADVWSRFMRAYQRTPEKLFCFFEGKDDPKYYNPRIREIVFRGQETLSRPLYCNGKDNVLALLALWETKPKYGNAHIAFFVDRDYDLHEESHDKLYVTPGYSFENLYVTRSAFLKVMRDEFLLDEEDDDYQPTLDLFELQLMHFLQAMRRVHVWLYLQRQKERKHKEYRQLHLKAHAPEGIINITLQTVTTKKEFASFLALFPNAYVVSDEELDETERKMQTSDEANFARGKYIIYFFREFLRRLVDDRRARDGRRVHFQQREPAVTLSLSDNIVSELTQYADTPACLHNFLTQLHSTRTYSSTSD